MARATPLNPTTPIPSSGTTSPKTEPKPATPLFKIGDNVELKSSIKWMTIVALRRNGNAVCAWFDPKGKNHRAVFPQAALDRAMRR